MINCLTREKAIFVCIIIANSLVYMYINGTILWYAFMLNTFVTHVNVPIVKYHFFFLNKVPSRANYRILSRIFIRTSIYLPLKLIHSKLPL